MLFEDVPSYELKRTIGCVLFLRGVDVGEDPQSSLDTFLSYMCVTPKDTFYFGEVIFSCRKRESPHNISFVYIQYFLYSKR